MLAWLLPVLFVQLAPLTISVAIPALESSEVVRRADVGFGCDCIDHWFKHGHFWLRASSTTGCMSLETISKKIYALNALPKPDYLSNDYPNLICSLIQSRCQWTWSPVDFLDSQGNASTSSTPACETLDNTRDLPPDVFPLVEGPAIPGEPELEAVLNARECEHAYSKR